MTNSWKLKPPYGRHPADGFDLDALLHPARAFEHPSRVVSDPDLTLNEKRAILASWASDACAVEAAPDLRSPVGGPVVRFDDIVDALKALDAQGQDAADSRRWRRSVRRSRLSGRGSDGSPTTFGGH